MFYAITSSLFFSIFMFAAKYVISKKMSSFISFIYMQGILIVAIFPILSLIIAPGQLALPPAEVIPYAYISGATSIIAYLLTYYGLTKYDASSAVPIVGIKPIFVIPLSYVFLGEFYGFDVILWIIIAVLGAVMTSWDENIRARQLFSFKNKALWIFMAAAFLYTAGNVAVKPAMKLVTNFNFLVWREIGWFCVLLALMPLIFHEENWASLRGEWRGALRAVLLVVLAQYFGYILLFYALGFSVQITEGLNGSQGLFAVAAGFVLSRTKSGLISERHESRIYLIRAVGALLILFGTYELSYAFRS
ncbi:DMT family transporter [Candidatus Bathyarchaeota archaeon]|nr:DMT family transporter [Candidatus Bathyarchaeota archaeon]